jgi:hypothetical protein
VQGLPLTVALFPGRAAQAAQRLSAFYNYPALFTAVSDVSGVGGDDFFEIVSLRVVGLKTFWTIAIGQVSGVDG